MSLLSVQDLNVHFSTPKGSLKALRGVSFELNKGETLGIVGESGSGKSVCSMAILDLLPNNVESKEGSIIFDGREIQNLPQEELRLYRGGGAAMIFQEPGRSFDPLYSIGKTLEETLKARWTEKDQLNQEELKKRVCALLEEVGIPDGASRYDHYPHQLSGGLLQRVMIASALASDPQLLIADEPTTALDVTIQAKIVELLLEIQKKRNLAILFITHDLALISSVADRVAVMYSGLIMEEGPASEVLHHPRHPYTKALLGALPQLGHNYRQGKMETIGGSIPNPLSPPKACPFEPRCKKAQDRCAMELPEIEEGKTQSRCFFPGGTS